MGLTDLEPRRPRTLVVNAKRSAFEVSVMRPSKWANPFVLTDRWDEEERDRVLVQFRGWALARERKGLRDEARRELRGRVLGCACKPLVCHGDVWADIADGRLKGEGDD